MRSQQQAEREEQQRIKNLVLNYDLGDDNDSNDGEDNPFSSNIIFRQNPNTKQVKGPEKKGSYRDPRSDKSNANRGFRARKLQLSDVDWYDATPTQKLSRPKSKNGLKRS